LIMSPGRFQSAAPPASRDPDLLAALLEGGSDVVLLLDAEQRIREAFGATAELAASPGQLTGRRIHELVQEGDVVRLDRMLARASRSPGAYPVAEMRMRFRDSSWRAVELFVRNELARPEVDGIVVTVRDVSERKATEERLRLDALHDPLTRLPNRTLFADRLSQALERQRRRGGRAAVLFLDLDDFKSVNDRLGHESGDELIIAVAGRIKASLRTTDSAARLGGDEFAVLLEQADEGAAVDVTKRILDAFEPPFVLDGEAVRVELSIGIATSSSSADTGSELLRRADMAMYAAKMGGKARYEVFQQRAEAPLRTAHEEAGQQADPVNVARLERAQRERDEIRALLDDPAAVQIRYQPIVELASGRIAGYEALARFEIDGPPDSIFAQAHRCGLGSFLEAKTITRALEAPARPHGTFLSLNLSPTALLSREVQRALPAALDNVIIEVTEQELAPRLDAVAEAVALVRRRGARLAIDDAGAGYAGLKHLMDYSPDLIKLDRTLIHGSHRDLHKGALVESLVRYARRVGAATCAEGVEERGDLDLIIAAGVDHAQGFLFASPAEPWISADGLHARVSSSASGLEPAQAARTPRDRLALMLSSASRWEDVDAVLTLIAMTLAANQAYLSRLDPRGSYVVLVAAHGQPAYDMPYPLAEYPTSAAVLESGVPRRVSIHDPAADPREVELLIAEGMVTALLHPVRADGETVGLLEIYSAQEREWTPEEHDYLEFVSGHLGGVLTRLRRSRSLAAR